MPPRSLLIPIFALLLALTLSPSITPLRAQEPAATPSHPDTVLLKTTLGDLSLHLDWTNAPENSAAFLRYAHDGTYASTAFDDMDEHCLYGGKPSASSDHLARNGNMIASAGPPGEFKLSNRKGAVGFRRTAGSCNPTKRSNCTQIYIMLTDHPEADGDFSVFGTLDAPASVMDAITTQVHQHTPVPFKVELGGK